MYLDSWFGHFPYTCETNHKTITLKDYGEVVTTYETLFMPSCNRMMYNFGMIIFPKNVSFRSIPIDYDWFENALTCFKSIEKSIELRDIPDNCEL
jgi:hypothetical protein